jgi:hypothetical protein
MRDWLFERLDLDPALAGDLLEERERGRSAFWYWRQVSLALWTGIWDAIRDHKLLALRAVATGFATEYLFILLWRIWGNGLSEAVNLCLVLLTETATGWVVARTHRAHRFPMVFAYLTCSLCWFFCPQLFWVREILANWDRIDPRGHAYVIYLLGTVFLTIAGIIIGSILVRPRKPLPVPHP